MVASAIVCLAFFVNTGCSLKACLAPHFTLKVPQHARTIVL